MLIVVIVEFDNNFANPDAAAIAMTLSTGSEGTAATVGAGNDYTLAASSLSIAQNNSSASTTISILDDSDDENTETITLTAVSSDTGVAGVKSSQKTVVVTINDEDLPTATVTVDKSSYTEGTDAQMIITGTLSKAKTFDSSIVFDIQASSTATQDIDFSSADDGNVADLSLNGIWTDPWGVVVDASGNHYVGDQNDRKIYKRAISNGAVTTLTGGGSYGSPSTQVTQGADAKHRDIRDMDIDSSGNIYYIERNAVMMVDTSNGFTYYIAGAINGSGGTTDGASTAARFDYMKGITVSSDGKVIYVTDRNKIRKIYTSDGATFKSLSGTGEASDLAKILVVTLAGTESYNYIDGALADARFQDPYGIDTDSSGDVIVRDNRGVRKIDISASTVSTIVEQYGSEGGVVVDSSDNIYFSAGWDSFIKKYSATAGLTEVINSRNDRGTVSGPIKTAKINRPRGLSINPGSGNIVFTQSEGGLREIDFKGTLRIPAGQTTGTYTLNIRDESIDEDNETIILKPTANSLAINPKNLKTVSSVDYMSFDSTTDDKTDGTNGLVIIDNDNPPTVSVTASSLNVAEAGGTTKLTFQIGDASSAGSKMDLDEGLKGDYPYIGTYNDHKYYIAQQWIRWTEAKEIAANLGGYLLTIDSEAENNWVKNNLGDYKWDTYWLGYSDAAEEGTFVWDNGSSSTYTNWNNGEPNNSGDEDYATFYGYQGTWNDLGANDGRYFIIEFSGTISSKAITVPYLVEKSAGFEASDATFTDSGSVTIAAGSSKAELTITGTADTVNEVTETLTYTIQNTDASNITNGTYDADAASVVVSIIDDEAPEVTWATSGSSFNENGGSVTVTATVKDNKIKASDSKLNLQIVDVNGAVSGLDYFVSELQKVNSFAGSSSGFADGAGAAAKFDYPEKITSDAAGNIYVADSDNNVIRKVTPSGVVSIYAGNGDYDWNRSTGNKMEVGFSRPRALAFNNAGNELFIAEQGSRRISKIDASGNVSLVSGNGNCCSAVDGNATTAEYGEVNALAFDRAGNLYVADNRSIRKLVVDGSGNWTVSTIAGNNGNYGDDNGTGTAARFRYTRDIVIDKSGSEDIMYVADARQIRKIVLSSLEVTAYANTNDNYGENDGTLQSAGFYDVNAMALDTSASSLTIYVADRNRIRKVTADGVETIAGQEDNGDVVGAFASAKFRYPYGLAVNSSGIYISDRENHKLKKIDLLPSITIPGGSSTGSITVNGIDDQLYESDTEGLTFKVLSKVNVASTAGTVTDDIAVTINSDDDAPIIKLSSNQDYVDENGGTAIVTVSLADKFSSSRSDMSASSKDEFYYLGEYKGSKYYASKDDNIGYKTYSDAKDYAATLGGQLAVVTSAGENDFITAGIYNEDPNYNQDNNRWLNHWIGHKYDTTSETWKWTNTAQSDYTNWGWDYNPDYIDRYYSQIEI